NPRPSAAPPKRGMGATTPPRPAFGGPPPAGLGDASARAPVATEFTPSPPPGFSEPRVSTRGDPQITLDLRDAAGRGIEELGVHLCPAAELVDREQARRGRELRLVLVQHGLDDRPV